MIKRLYARLQRWARAITARRLRRYEVPLDQRTRTLLNTPAEELDGIRALGLLVVLLSFQPWNYIRTSWVGEYYNRFVDRDTLKRRIYIKNAREELDARLGHQVRIITDYQTRRLYSRDLAEVPPLIEKVLFRTTPHLVVQPRHAADISIIFAFAAERRLRVFPRGISSWGYGGAIPTSNGILLDISAMHDIESLDQEQAVITVQAGSRWGIIQDYLEARGFSLVVYPSNRFATVGGWISTGGIGLNCYKYGAIGSWIEWIEMVFPTGEVRRIPQADPAFELILDTEGHLGVITRVGLKVMPLPECHFPYLLYFEGDEDAFPLVEELASRGIVPAHIKFLDVNMMRATNRTAAAKAGVDITSFQPVVEEKDALFLHFDDPEHAERFRSFIGTTTRARVAEPPAANYVYHERFSPMKVQVLGRGLLASEVILPLGRTRRYIQAAKKLGLRYGIDVLIQAHVINPDNRPEVAVLPTFTCDQRNPIQYMLLLPLVQMMTRLGIRMGGVPYGIGIWNAPFFASKFSAAKARELARMKQQVDPNRILNPRKFTNLQTRFFNLPAKVFSPWFFSLSMDLMILISPILGMMVKATLERGPAPRDFHEETALRCTKCGNCAAVCPAYIVSDLEAVTPRAKLRLIRRFKHGRSISRSEAERFFLCMHCGECARVCQSMLPLKRVWEEFEAVLEETYERPRQRMEEFVERVTTSQAYLDQIGSEPYRYDLERPVVKSRPGPSWETEAAVDLPARGGSGA